MERESVCACVCVSVRGREGGREGLDLVYLGRLMCL